MQKLKGTKTIVAGCLLVGVMAGAGGGTGGASRLSRAVPEYEPLYGE